MTDISEQWRRLINSVDTRRLIMDVFFEGFDTVEDYVKYGGAFVKLKVPYSRRVPVSPHMWPVSVPMMCVAGYRLDPFAPCAVPYNPNMLLTYDRANGVLQG